ncbi:hypothetical protein FJZ31_41475 [Candidatus Poribacteria bacterium]|nr:hypothetical protein [Candidatus Poribacteria bacterium]
MLIALGLSIVDCRLMIALGLSIVDCRLLIEKTFLQSTIINHQSSIQGHQATIINPPCPLAV